MQKNNAWDHPKLWSGLGLNQALVVVCHHVIFTGPVLIPLFDCLMSGEVLLLGLSSQNFMENSLDTMISKT
jgi:hypothetical protein